MRLATAKTAQDRRPDFGDCRLPGKCQSGIRSTVAWKSAASEDSFRYARMTFFTKSASLDSVRANFSTSCGCAVCVSVHKSKATSYGLFVFFTYSSPIVRVGNRRRQSGRFERPMYTANHRRSRAQADQTADIPERDYPPLVVVGSRLKHRMFLRQIIPRRLTPTSN